MAWWAANRWPAGPELYRVEVVKEKPTPTEAEEHLIVPGLRAGYYLCFFGMHVLTAGVMDLLEHGLRAGKAASRLSGVLNQLARREQYLALEESNRRYDVGVRYGLLTAQMALALAGRDREQVLANLLELLATREMEDTGGLKSAMSELIGIITAASSRAQEPAARRLLPAGKRRRNCWRRPRRSTASAAKATTCTSG
jgi:hypothetical protein